MNNPQRVRHSRPPVLVLDFLRVPISLVAKMNKVIYM